MANDEEEDGLFGPSRKRGRPPGSRNRPKVTAVAPRDDYAHADPDTLISRQLLLLDWTQQAIKAAMRKAMNATNIDVAAIDVAKLEKLSNAIVRAIEGLKKSSDLADELANRMTPEQLLEAAMKKIEGQDLATVRYAIKRLRAHRDRLLEGQGLIARPAASAAEAISELEENE